MICRTRIKASPAAISSRKPQAAPAFLLWAAAPSLRRVGLARGASAGKDANPFAYDVERLRKTDPKLIHYEQVGHFASPGPDPRRIVIGPEDRVYIAAGNAVSVLDRDGTRIKRH